MKTKSDTEAIQAEAAYEKAESAYVDQLNQMASMPLSDDETFFQELAILRQLRAELEAANKNRFVFAITALGRAAIQTAIQ